MLPVTFYGKKEHFFKTYISLLKSKTGKNELFGFYFFTLLFLFEEKTEIWLSCYLDTPRATLNCINIQFLFCSVPQK